MLSLFQKKQRNIIGFEDIKYVIENPRNYLLINTLNIDEQSILIKNTINVKEEESVINNILTNYNIPDKPIIIYGKNSGDNSVERKYDQIINFGLKDVFIYYGGLFEWLLLNELYGFDEFPLNENHTNIDILKYRCIKTI